MQLAVPDYRRTAQLPMIPRFVRQNKTASLSDELEEDITGEDSEDGENMPKRSREQRLIAVLNTKRCVVPDVISQVMR